MNAFDPLNQIPARRRDRPPRPIPVATLLKIWSAYALLAGFWLFAWGTLIISREAPRMSIVEAGFQVNLNAVLGDAIPMLWIGITASILLWYSLGGTRYRRLTAAVTGLVLPLVGTLVQTGHGSLAHGLGQFFLGPVLAFVVPLQALLRRCDGTFYNEGRLFWSAVGWWSILCLYLTSRQIAHIRARKKAALYEVSAPPTPH
jgi:hypothetical protein